MAHQQAERLLGHDWNKSLRCLTAGRHMGATLSMHHDGHLHEEI